MTDQPAPTYLTAAGTCWPNPHDPRDLTWKLMRGIPLDEGDRVVAAAYISAYRRLVNSPAVERDRAIAGIRAALLAAGTRG